MLWPFHASGPYMYIVVLNIKAKRKNFNFGCPFPRRIDLFWIVFHLGYAAEYMPENQSVSN